MRIAGSEMTLESVTLLSTGAGIRVDDELPDWAAPEGKISAGFDPAIFESSARVRIDVAATASDSSYAVRAELLCEFTVMDGGDIGRDWPASDEQSVIDAVWPHARGALQAAAFSIDKQLPLRRLPQARSSR